VSACAEGVEPGEDKKVDIAAYVGVKTAETGENTAVEA